MLSLTWSFYCQNIGLTFELNTVKAFEYLCLYMGEIFILSQSKTCFDLGVNLVRVFGIPTVTSAGVNLI